jgi:hypothetical protein
MKRVTLILLICLCLTLLAGCGKSLEGEYIEHCTFATNETGATTSTCQKDYATFTPSP